MGTLSEIKDAVLQFLAGGIGLWAIHELRELKNSIVDLNIQMAVSIKQRETLEDMVEDHEERLRTLEQEG